jgi:general secretion pathway protein M
MKNLNLSSITPKNIALPFNLNLQPRERLAVMIAGAALLVFLIFQLLIFPSINRRDRLKNRIAANVSALKEISALKSEYEALTQYSRNMGDRLKRRPKNFTLFSFIDKLAGTSGIKNNIEYMKPSTSNLKNSSLTLSLVEMKISSLTMEQLTNFLHGVENGDAQVWIKRISIQKGDKNVGLINTTLQVETVQQ